MSEPRQAAAPAAALIVMAKAPSPGLAKTRLIGAPGWTPQRVALLADAFVRDTLRAAERACERVPGAQVVACFAPRESEGYFREVAPRARLVAQVDGDLGARLEAAFASLFEGGARRAVAVGTDTPHLSPDTIERAFDALERNDCVLGPASDGGYYLIGLGRRAPSLFRDVEWGTDRVLARTREHARHARLRTALLEESFDVDRPRDLERLARLLGPDGEPCPHTARVLAACS